jgi:hypothetical protein
MLQDEIVVILCELVIYSPPPPRIRDIYVHFFLHVVDDIRQLGPTFLHNMMPLKIYMSTDMSVADIGIPNGPPEDGTGVY